MRIWSLHPRYLDSKGLVALWRETLLAQKVLQGETKGYKNHPQLERFKGADSPLDAVRYYLSEVWIEANNRRYKFDKSKIGTFRKNSSIPVTAGQVIFERDHLLYKLKQRDKKQFINFKKIENPETHPLFYLVSGEIEQWEIK